MKSKKLFITGIVIFSAVVVLATFLLLWYWGDTYPQFDGTFNAEFGIPGLADGATPQGITNWKTDALKPKAKTAIKLRLITKATSTFL